MTGRIVVVGLGPAGDDHLLPVARAAIERISVRFARTARHRALEDLRADGIDFVAFDDEYERHDRIEAVYRAIVDRLVAAAGTHGEVLYAVPGNPAVAERTTTLLRRRTSEPGGGAPVELVVVPGLSFAELAWTRLGVDPTQGNTRVVDAHSIGTDAVDVSGALLIVQCDARSVLSDVKLHLLEYLDGDETVTVLQRLGRSDEHVGTVTLADLDRDVEPDHLTSVYVDTGTVAIGADFARFVELMETLRGPGGCPWDAEQTHTSLRRYAIEEAYEVVEAIGGLPVGAPQSLPPGSPPPAGYEALADELGDLLCQVVFHSVLAREAGAFTIDDVVRGIHEKLLRRHPHVFGDAGGATIDLPRAWEQSKLAEKGTDSIVAGITPDLPALLYALKLARKMASVGLVPLSPETAGVQAATALQQLPDTPVEQVDAVLGELLGAIVVLARDRGVDAESALRSWSGAQRDRFATLERVARSRGIDLAVASPQTVAEIWAEIASDPRPSRVLH